MTKYVPFLMAPWVTNDRLAGRADQLLKAIHLTGNQIVAYNLRRARMEHGWTQIEASKRIGLGWSKAVYSAAERSAVNQRIRQFDADEIVAMANAFDRDVSFFFAKPEPFSIRVDPVVSLFGKRGPTLRSMIAEGATLQQATVELASGGSKT